MKIEIKIKIENDVEIKKHDNNLSLLKLSEMSDDDFEKAINLTRSKVVLLKQSHQG